MQSPPRSLRPYERHGVVSHPPFWAKNPSPLTVALSQQNAPFNRKKGKFGKGIFQKEGQPMVNHQPTAEQLSCIHNNHEEPNFVQKDQAFWIWVINNTQKYARCTDQATPTRVTILRQGCICAMGAGVQCLPTKREIGISLVPLRADPAVVLLIRNNNDGHATIHSADTSLHNPENSKLSKTLQTPPPIHPPEPHQCSPARTNLALSLVHDTAQVLQACVLYGVLHVVGVVKKGGIPIDIVTEQRT